MKEPVSADFSQLAAEKVGQMTLAEKIGLMTGRRLNLLLIPLHFLIFKHYNKRPYQNGGVARLGVPAMKFCDGPRGVASNRSTCFPVAMARGACFDPGLEKKVGEAMGREVIAAGGNYFGGVCINLLRHPAWGRAQETYGEDSHLLGEMGVALTRGVQSQGVMACIKHYALNSMENARFKVDVHCSERALREVYLPHFKAAIDAGAASVMTAYNKVRGQYCGENSELNCNILRDEWGFDGFVISDFVWGMYSTEGSLKGGMDIEMPWPRFYGRRLKKLAKADPSVQALIDASCERIVRTVLRHNETLVNNPVSADVSACKAHRELAQRVAEKSMTLLKNSDSTLPLDVEKTATIAVLGELATEQNIGDRGSSKVTPPQVITALQGLEQYCAGKVAVNYEPGDSLAKATQAASQADAAVLIVGNRHSDEGEYLVNARKSPGGDRLNLGLKPHEVELIKAVAAVNKNTIVVVIAGSAITMADWDADVAAILFAYYPGMEGGTAIARTLFGEVNPGGRLPFSIPESADHLPFFDRDALEIDYGYYHGYTLLDKDRQAPAYAFGFGLSYTNFEYSEPTFQSVEGAYQASIKVSNIGASAGDSVVQLYLGCSQSSVDRPKRVLKAFQRVTLEPGEGVRVTLTAPADALQWYDEQSRTWQPETAEHELYIGSSSREKDLFRGRLRPGGNN